MRLPETKQLFSLALTMMLSAVVCLGQTHKRIRRSHAPQPQVATPSLPTSKTIALNDDGSYVVEIGGQKHRALNRKQLDDLAVMEKELIGARKLIENLKADNSELEGQKTSWTNEKAQLDIKFNASEEKVRSLTTDLGQCRADTARHFDLLRDEIKLNNETAGQFIPHSSAKGFWGRLLTVMDRPEFQFTVKAVVPFWNAARCSR